MKVIVWRGRPRKGKQRFSWLRGYAAKRLRRKLGHRWQA